MEKEELIPIINRKNNKIIKFEKKTTVHEQGLLHIAISVFIFNSKNYLMLQKRSSKKYHSPLLWTNTCCSHPRKDESILEAAHRCLNHEMGFDCSLTYKFFFLYKENMSNGLIEHELDHVFVGVYNHIPKINSEEVDNWKWITTDQLYHSISNHPNVYTPWLRIICNKYLQKIKI